MRRLDSIFKAQEARWKERNVVCTRAAQMQQIKMLKEHVVLQAKISISLNHKYKKVHLVVKTILLWVQMETEAVLFSFLREMHS